MSGIVVIKVICPHHGMAWRDAIVSIVMALLAQWWFTNYPVRYELPVAFTMVSCSSSGIMAIVRE
jgi:hypothetical protein